MAYAKTNWKDRIVENPRTYDLTNNVDGSIILTPKPGEVIEEGTPISASSMNKIEEKLYDVDKGLEPQVTTGTAEAYIADIPESTAIITIIPHIDNIGNTTINGMSIYTSEGELVNTGDLKKDIPIQMVRVGNRVFIVGSASSAIPKFLRTEPAWEEYYPNALESCMTASMAYYEKSIYFFGNSTSLGTDAQKFDLNTGTWQRLTRLPAAYSSGAAVAYQGKIYLVGCYSGLMCKSIYAYDIETDSYSHVIDIPSSAAVTNARVALYQDNIFIFYIDYGWQYNITDNALTTLATNPKNVMISPCSIFEDKIYFFGYDTTYLDITYYDIATNTYSVTGATTIGKLYYGFAVTLGQNIFIMGGSNNFSVEKYNILRNTCTQLSNMRFSGNKLQCVAEDGVIYMGCSQTIGENLKLRAYHPTIDIWRIPSGISISPMHACIKSRSGAGEYISSIQAYNTTATGDFEIITEQIFTMQRGLNVLYAATHDSPIPIQTPLQQAPARFAASSGILVGDSIYLFGGNPEIADYTKNIKAHKYDIATDTYVEIAPPPIACACMSLAYKEDTQQIYLAGSILNEVAHYVYDINTNSYKRLPDTPYSNRGPGMAYHNDKIHLCSGGTNYSVYSVYDITTGTYTEKASVAAFATGLYHNKSIKLRDSLYIGYFSGGQLKRISLDYNAYDNLASLTDGSYASAYCLCDNLIFRVGGESRDKELAYTSPNYPQTSVPLAILIRGFREHIAIGVKTRIFVFGGINSSDRNQVLAIRITPKQMWINGKCKVAGQIIEGNGLTYVDHLL